MYAAGTPVRSSVRIAAPWLYRRKTSRPFNIYFPPHFGWMCWRWADVRLHALTNAQPSHMNEHSHKTMKYTHEKITKRRSLWAISRTERTTWTQRIRLGCATCPSNIQYPARRLIAFYIRNSIIRKAFSDLFACERGACSLLMFALEPGLLLLRWPTACDILCFCSQMSQRKRNVYRALR